AMRRVVLLNNGASVSGKKTYNGPPARVALRRDILRVQGLACLAEARRSRAKAGGEAGIRTLGRAFRPYNGLANRRLQPLGHLTAARKLSINEIATYAPGDVPTIVPKIVPAVLQNRRGTAPGTRPER